ncbi:hypothetical protein FACS189420_8420 [Bacteroidia bacterium]|nr:hypothetical protein FACS189420_8420 [Bacteroidia bacterium]
MKGGKFETFRVKGFGKVKRNDVIVFNFPYSDWSKLQPDLGVFYLKRCVAIPGEGKRGWFTASVEKNCTTVDYYSACYPVSCGEIFNCSN